MCFNSIKMMLGKSGLSKLIGVARVQLASLIPRFTATQAATTPAPANSPNKITPAPQPTKQEGLMEFFDLKENWAINEVRVGRSWRKDELRIKSNQDLHKLWFVLLKERNMLLTMQHEMNDNCYPFPSPERLDKVHESMVNLEEVVRERNRAYYLLETGETGERPGRLAVNKLSMQNFFKFTEHPNPPPTHLGWFINRHCGCRRREVAKFRLYLNEQIWLKKLRAQRRERNHVKHLYKRFPYIDEEALQEQYPNVDLDKIKKMQGSQGHFTPRNY